MEEVKKDEFGNTKQIGKVKDIGGKPVYIPNLKRPPEAAKPPRVYSQKSIKEIYGTYANYIRDVMAGNVSGVYLYPVIVIKDHPTEDEALAMAKDWIMKNPVLGQLATGGEFDLMWQVTDWNNQDELGYNLTVNILFKDESVLYGFYFRLIWNGIQGGEYGSIPEKDKLYRDERDKLKPWISNYTRFAPNTMTSYYGWGNNRMYVSEREGVKYYPTIEDYDYKVNLEDSTVKVQYNKNLDLFEVHPMDYNWEEDVKNGDAVIMSLNQFRSGWYNEKDPRTYIRKKPVVGSAYFEVTRNGKLVYTGRKVSLGIIHFKPYAEYLEELKYDAPMIYVFENKIINGHLNSIVSTSNFKTTSENTNNLILEFKVDGKQQPYLKEPKYSYNKWGRVIQPPEKITMWLGPDVKKGSKVQYRYHLGGLTNDKQENLNDNLPIKDAQKAWADAWNTTLINVSYTTEWFEQEIVDEVVTNKVPEGFIANELEELTYTPKLTDKVNEHPVVEIDLDKNEAKIGYKDE